MQNKLHFNTSNFSKEKKDRLFKSIQKESEKIGYYKLPEQDISEINDYVQAFDANIEHIVVLGIGGSSLGAKAIDEFLKPIKVPRRKLHFFESTDPINIACSLSKIDMEKAHFLVISKSGGTVETISIFKYVYAPRPDKENFTFITDKGSNLDKFAQDLGSKIFYLPPNVGGRFSVLSVVGLLPLALAGVNIQDVLKGAKEVKDSFFGNGHLSTALIEKAFFYAKNHTTYNINCLFAYSDTLKYFTEWYVQLWGESLGKEQRNSAFNVGLTPIGLIGPKDQHSFLQLIVEGTRDKSVTFIKIQDFEHEMYIPPVTLKHLEALDNVNGVAFHELINLQCNSVMESLENKGDIPLDEIVINQVNEESIGGLMYYYELLTSLVGELIDVNTYDQPGVEEGKIILKKKLMD
jgi:glucose-6-phosphate isomerase